MSAVQTVGQELAKAALSLQVQVAGLQIELDVKKEELREFANGKKLNIIIEGLGKIDVTEPRAGSEKTILTIDEKRVLEVDGLKDMLVKKGVAKEEIKKTPPAKASVRIKPNV